MHSGLFREVWLASRRGKESLGQQVISLYFNGFRVRNSATAQGLRTSDGPGQEVMPGRIL